MAEGLWPSVPRTCASSSPRSSSANAFSVNPPRVTQQYGDVLVKILGSGFVKSVAQRSPGPIALTLAEPVSVDDVAGAVCAGVFGRNQKMSCDGTDEIKACAAAM